MSKSHLSGLNQFVKRLKMRVKTVLLLLFMCKPFSYAQDQENQVIVNTKSGLVLGSAERTQPHGKPYFRFLGIPFAEPPIGDLRFEPPVPNKPWEGLLNATEYGPSCLVGSDPIEGSEDCLFINVFTPSIQNLSKLPVIVWIHGGGFIEGSGNLTDTQPDFFLEEDIIFVSLQYRLGFFGFLSSGDLVAPGNLGLKDQILALKWVQDNVESFGGDKKNVTLFGQSAGGVSISFLLQTNLTEGLFQRAIMDSGVSLCLWGLSQKAVKVTKSIAEALKIDTTNTTIMINELKKANHTELKKLSNSLAIQELLAGFRHGPVFAPVIEPEHEGAVITESSHERLKKGMFQKVPILLGHNSLEAIANISVPLRYYLLKYDFIPSSLVPPNMNVADNRKDEVGLKIKTKYFDVIPIALSDRNVLVHISDDTFTRPIQEFARLWSQYKDDVFFYHFEYEGNLWGRAKDRPVHGVGHTEELGYLFLSPFKGSETDNLVRNTMVKLWSNFAKHSDPNGIGNDIKIWPRFGSEAYYLSINDTLKSGRRLNEDKFQFWKELYGEYGSPPFITF